MPAKNTVKMYIENGYYHIYNRGVEKREIFMDEQDCRVFLFYLKIYLSPVEELEKQSIENPRITRFIPLNLSSEIDLLVFALMPNHMHLLVKQHSRDAITKLMRRIATSYAMYFNKKYKRVGRLFQNIYKAVHVEQDDYLLHLSRYIHLNPSNLTSHINFLEFSSYLYYLRQKNANWVKPQEILEFFKGSQKTSAEDILSYQSFVEDYKGNSLEVLNELTLEEET